MRSAGQAASLQLSACKHYKPTLANTRDLLLGMHVLRALIRAMRIFAILGRVEV
jgi:hypothetical protein